MSPGCQRCSLPPPSFPLISRLAAPGAPDALKSQFVVVAYSDCYTQCSYQGGAFRTNLLENWLKATGMTDVNLKTFVAHPDYDRFWAGLNPEAQAARVHAPVALLDALQLVLVQRTADALLDFADHKLPLRR